LEGVVICLKRIQELLPEDQPTLEGSLECGIDGSTFNPSESFVEQQLYFVGIKTV
jgi:hypothetical protein